LVSGYDGSMPAPAANYQKITAVLTVTAIEPCLPLWVERLGFEQTMAVPGDDGLVFVALQGGGMELMLQTRASLATDLPAVAAAPTGPAFLFIEVADLDAILPHLLDSDIAVQDHLTFYGMREVTVLTAGGHFVTLAQPVTKSELD
jgi:pimeloyl-ACP methyl ester carboxylesterase